MDRFAVTFVALSAWLVAALGASCFLLASPASAQPDSAEPAASDALSDVERTASARALFEEGMRAVDARDWATAADRLGRSFALRPSTVVRFNFALALTELGRLVEASEHLRGVVRATEEGSDVHRLASERLETILPRLGRLRVDVSGDRAGVEVRLDGAVMPNALVGVTQPADPGAHRVTLHRAREELAAADVTVTSGEVASVELEAPPAPVASIPAGDPVTQRDDDVAGAWWLWTLIALAVVGAGVGIVLGIVLSEPPPYVLGDSGVAHPTLLEVTW